MRIETRFLIETRKAIARAQHLCSSTNCLKYKVTNFYLDTCDKQFSQTTPGSPRFRIRLYEVDELLFGNIEFKKVEFLQGKEFTSKETLDVTEYWSIVNTLIPELRERNATIKKPNIDSAYTVLTTSPTSSDKSLDFEGVFFLDYLTYCRSSYSNELFRITVDYNFSPSILADDYAILEYKGQYNWKAIEDLCGLQEISESKFALLSKLRKHQN